MCLSHLTRSFMNVFPLVVEVSNSNVAADAMVLLVQSPEKPILETGLYFLRKQSNTVCAYSF